MIKPNRLKKGDTIGIVAPASPLSVINEEYIKRGITKLQSLGFTVVFGQHVRKMHRRAAGTIQERVEDLHDMFLNPEVAAVITAIGGYNSNDLLEYVDFALITKNPKIFMGYSDTTVLNNALVEKAKLVNFSGPAFVTFCDPEISEYTLSHFRNTLMYPSSPAEISSSSKYAEDDWHMTHSESREWRANNGFGSFNKGVVTGKILGGNLDSFVALCNTPYFPNVEGSILFFEVNKQTDSRKVCQQLTQLRQSGIFSKINGLVFGRFGGQVGFCEQNTIDMMLHDVLRGHDLPVLYNVNFGHTDPMITLPLGIECRIDTEHKKIEYLEGAVV